MMTQYIVPFIIWFHKNLTTGSRFKIRIKNVFNQCFRSSIREHVTVIQNHKSLAISEQQLLQIVIDLLVSGTETSTTTMRWFILFMITHPKVQARMREEIHDVIGHSQYPSMSHKDNMPYSEAVLTETLRIGCIAPLSIPHGLTKELKYGQFLIPDHAVLIPNIYSVLFDPTIFERPESYHSERFLDDNGKLNRKETYVVSFCLGNFLYSFLYADQILSIQSMQKSSSAFI